MTAFLLAILIGCSGDKGDDTSTTGDGGGSDGGGSDGGGSGDGGGDGGTGSDGGSDGGTSGDGGSDGGSDGGAAEEDGLLTWEGEATLGANWTGQESIVLRGDGGLGDTHCSVRYAVTSTAEADDCPQCLYAYEVVLGPATVEIDRACEQAGVDAATVAAIEGTVRAYGLALDYLGHSNALLVRDGAAWAPVAFVDWNSTSLTLSYQWDQGYVTYTPDPQGPAAP